jgi:hypothetical protein
MNRFTSSCVCTYAATRHLHGLLSFTGENLQAVLRSFIQPDDNDSWLARMSQSHAPSLHPGVARRHGLSFLPDLKHRARDGRRHLLLIIGLTPLALSWPWNGTIQSLRHAGYGGVVVARAVGFV